MTSSFLRSRPITSHHITSLDKLTLKMPLQGRFDPLIIKKFIRLSIGIAEKNIAIMIALWRDIDCHCHYYILSLLRARLYCCFVARLYCCFVARLYCCFIARLYCCFVARLYCYFVARLYCCFVQDLTADTAGFLLPLGSGFRLALEITTLGNKLKNDEINLPVRGNEEKRGRVSEAFLCNTRAAHKRVG